MIKRGYKVKKSVVILSSIILLSFVLMTINIRSSGPFFLEKALGWVVAPVQSAFTETVKSISGVFRHYFFLVNVTKENELLKQENDNLKKHNNDLV